MPTSLSLTSLTTFFRRVRKKFPLLAEHYKRVLNVPEIMEWVKKRPVTEFQSCGASFQQIDMKHNLYISHF